MIKIKVLHIYFGITLCRIDITLNGHTMVNHALLINI